MKQLFLIVCVLACFARAEVDESDVLVLTDKNFHESIKSGLVLVEFYAPWCGHCKKLTPEWAQAATELKNAGAKASLGKVDATIETTIAEEYAIQGFPTIILFRDGVKSEYNGGRTAPEIVKYINKKLQPVVIESITADRVKELIPTEGKGELLVVGHLSGNAADAFRKVATSLSERFVFGLTSDKAVGDAHGIPEGSIALFKPFDDLKNIFTGDADKLEAFLNENELPLVDEITPNNYKKYVDRGLPILWLFLDPSESAIKDELTAELGKVAPEFRQLSLVWLNGVQYSQMVTKMALSGKLPAIAIETSDGLHFPFDEEKSITAAGLRPWLADWRDGKLKAKVKSEPVPENPVGEDGVYVLVGDTFKDVVFDTEKDVFIEFYAPWCGHCKSLAPIYSELAEELKSNPKIVIAKMDSTANDATPEFKVQGFPTLKLVKAGSNEIVDYEGSRTKSAFLKFLKQHAASGNDIGASDAAAADDEL
jgi:protein disulfide-isomerase A1